MPADIDLTTRVELPRAELPQAEPSVLVIFGARTLIHQRHR